MNFISAKGGGGITSVVINLNFSSMANQIINKISSRPAFRQLGKFFLVGTANFIIDITVYNVLMWLTGIHKGFYLVLFSTISFLAALINSYFLNKYWTFRDRKEESSLQFIKFFTVASIGLVLNNSIVYYITTLANPMFGLTPVLWANFAKIAATFAVLFWNFIGFKFLVFKK